MYDRQVRRRRMVLAVFVIASILLLTAYFGESAGGGLHAVQRGALSVLGPIQEGASRALKPFRDLFGWVGGTVDAKQERDKLRRENVALQRQVADLLAAAQENSHLKGLLRLNTQGGLDQYDPVKARVTARNTGLFYSEVTIDKGSSSGVHTNQPVVGPEGLVGRVTDVTPGYSIVTLISDSKFAAAARDLNSNVQGLVKPFLNRPGDLQLQVLDGPQKVRTGDLIVTAGSLDLRLRDYFPPNIPIGRVGKIDYGNGDLDIRMHVKPAVDLGNLLWVEVLTRQAQPQLQASANPTGTPAP